MCLGVIRQIRLGHSVAAHYLNDLFDGEHSHESFLELNRNHLESLHHRLLVLQNLAHKLQSA